MAVYHETSSLLYCPGSVHHCLVAKINRFNKEQLSSRLPLAAQTFEDIVPTSSCCGTPPPPWTRSRASCRCWRTGCPQCPPPGCSPSSGTSGTCRRTSSASQHGICRWEGRRGFHRGWWTGGRRGHGAYSTDPRQRTLQTSSPCPFSILVRTTSSQASSPSPLEGSSPRSLQEGSSQLEVQPLHRGQPPGRWRFSGRQLRAGGRLLPPWSRIWSAGAGQAGLQARRYHIFVEIVFTFGTFCCFSHM